MSGQLMLSVKVALQWSPSHHSCTRSSRSLLVSQYMTQGHTPDCSHSCSSSTCFLMQAGHRVELLSAPLFTE